MSEKRRWLIVGLGNPGPKYLLTRHNVGFICLDRYVDSLNLSGWSTQEKALLLKIKGQENELFLAKPQTYMNLSGESVQPLMAYYKIPLENLIVLHDEIDIPFGKLRIQKNRGAGGHNGLKSINERLGTQDYTRIKIGVGRPPHPEMNVADYVLQNFSSEEQTQLPDFLDTVGDALDALITVGLDRASSNFNK